MNSNIAMLYVDEGRCSGCGVCVGVCPHGAIVVEEGKASIRQALCQQCEACAAACPERAILSVTEGALVPELDRVRAVRPQEPSRPLSVVARAAPALGAALLFLGREVMPRVADYVLDVVDRRMHQGTKDLVEPSRFPVDSETTSGSGRRRRRRHRGA
jgi:Pyruvate/2-oxoacid:ferredoxin oxidoreductase delta subunit